MLVLGTILAGAFGLIIGSFLNVVVLRHNTGRSLAGRSGCLSCRATLTPMMLIPVLSWVLLRRRCSSCGTKISWQYPLVELATGFLFALTIYAQLPWFTTILSLAVIAVLICIAAYDILHTIIPDEWVYATAGLALIMRGGAALQTSFPMTDVVMVVLSGFLVAAPLFLLWLATRGRGIGLGDVKLGLVVGWFLGFGAGMLAVMLSFVIGAIVSVCILLPLPYYRRMLAYCGLLRQPHAGAFTMKSEVPFGPFLIAGTLLVWFTFTYGIDITALLWGIE
ncbi:MAG: prepilin peptidase [Parcubacteria group bacterium]|nr:prepilin peptidase [Parcubacteria group bacterium]